MGVLGKGISSRVSEWAASLRFPHLLGLVVILFFIDLVVPDLVPFLDEIMLALTAVLLGSWRRRRDPR